jgi:hypothetical protein
MPCPDLPCLRSAGPVLTAVLAVFLALSGLPCLHAQRRADVAPLLVQIREEVVGLPRYPGEDFWRGEFFLGEGDDDTNKTHAVGILVKDEDGRSRMTIVISRLEPARDNPRVKHTRDPMTIVCAFAADGVDLVRSDSPAAELEKSLGAVLKAVRDKKALLKRSDFVSGTPSRGGEGNCLEDPQVYFPLRMAIRGSRAGGLAEARGRGRRYRLHRPL